MNKNANKLLNFIDISRPRRVIISSELLYTEETYHPERVMSCHDLFVMIEGEWGVAQDGIEYKAEVNDDFFLFAGRHHYGPVKCTKNTKTVFIHFEALDTDYYGEPTNSKTNLIEFPVKTSCLYNYDVKKYCIEIAHLFWSHNPMKKLMMDAYARVIFYTLNKIWSDGQNSISKAMFNIISIINGDLTKFYSLDELAKLTYFSKRTIISIFKKNMGTTPHQFQLNMKLDLCYTRLMNEPATLIKELAIDLGFADEYHLSRKFKEKFGVSPIEIKKRAATESV